MSKVIVFENCKECPKASWGYKHLICTRKNKDATAEGIPDWCPLFDFPEKKTWDKNFIFSDEDYATKEIQAHLEVYGWNKCCDCILTGKDELEPELKEMEEEEYE